MTEQSPAVFSGPIWTSYRQICIVSPDCRDLVPENAYRGQSNGLCGGAVPGGLFLTVGIHTGPVQITVQVLDTAPPVDSSWDEIVEASCTFPALPVHLEGWSGQSAVKLPLAKGEYRARYCAKAFGGTEAKGEDDDGDDGSAECYLLTLWPEALRPDEVRKQTSAKAAYWHREAKSRSASDGSLPVLERANPSD
jgi:hypothetical protein